MKKSKVEKALIQGLRDAIDYERGEITLKTSFRETVEEAPHLSKKQIRSLRIQVLNMSQSVFASILNVSPKTVESWEQGLNEPAPIADRLLHLLRKDPVTIQKLLIARP